MPKVYKKILVPLDGSKLSECALDHVKAVATGCKVSDVVLLMVWVEPITSSYQEYFSEKQATEMGEAMRKVVKEARQKDEDYLSKAANSLRKEGITVQHVLVSPKLAEGTAETILDYAKDNKVDLIIMSTHGRSGISRWAFGSVTERVVRHANAPVLTISPPGCRES
jgi:nucleotide-binding universal stress UspA family protein